MTVEDAGGVTGEKVEPFFVILAANLNVPLDHPNGAIRTRIHVEGRTEYTYAKITRLDVERTVGIALYGKTSIALQANYPVRAVEIDG